MNEQPLTGIVIPVAGLPSEKLAPQINRLHRQVEASYQDALTHALHAGELLTQAKKQLPHGQWLQWLRDQCDIPERSAQLYMKLFRELPPVLPRGTDESAMLADLSLQQAIRLLAAPAKTEDASSQAPASPPREPLAASTPDSNEPEGPSFPALVSESERFIGFAASLAQRNPKWIIGAMGSVNTLAKAMSDALRRMEADDKLLKSIETMSEAAALAVKKERSRKTA